MIGGADGMNRRRAAVAVRWSGEDGASGSSPAIPNVRADGGGTGREGVDMRKPIVALGIFLFQPTSLLPSYHLAA